MRYLPVILIFCHSFMAIAQREDEITGVELYFSEWNSFTKTEWHEHSLKRKIHRRTVLAKDVEYCLKNKLKLRKSFRKLRNARILLEIHYKDGKTSKMLMGRNEVMEYGGKRYKLPKEFLFYLLFYTHTEPEVKFVYLPFDWRKEFRAFQEEYREGGGVEPPSAEPVSQRSRRRKKNAIRHFQRLDEWGVFDDEKKGKKKGKKKKKKEE